VAIVLKRHFFGCYGDCETDTIAEIFVGGEIFCHGSRHWGLGRRLGEWLGGDLVLVFKDDVTWSS
jgi:hypothetical protein